jgi:hypothetical protein
MSVCIVVARYHENIEWTKQFSNVVIYNKGGEIDAKCIPLNNVGREGHTYYKYICDHYDDLSDYTVFLQGNPFDHTQNIITKLHQCIHTKLESDFELLSDFIFGCNLSGCSIHHNLPLIDTYEKIFKERKTDLSFKVGNGGQFIVSKKYILNRPKSFYETIVDILGKEVNPIEGYVIERFHELIFNPSIPFINPEEDLHK